MLLELFTTTTSSAAIVTSKGFLTTLLLPLAKLTIPTSGDVGLAATTASAFGTCDIRRSCMTLLMLFCYLLMEMQVLHVHSFTKCLVCCELILASLLVNCLYLHRPTRAIFLKKKKSIYVVSLLSSFQKYG